MEILYCGIQIYLINDDNTKFLKTLRLDPNQTIYFSFFSCNTGLAENSKDINCKKNYVAS